MSKTRKYPRDWGERDIHTEREISMGGERDTHVEIGIGETHTHTHGGGRT